MSADPLRAVIVRVSPQDFVVWQECARRLQYERFWNVHPEAAPAGEVFAHCITDSVHRYLLARAQGERLPRPMAYFRTLWEESLSNTPLSFERGYPASRYLRMGRDLMQQLPTAWERSGLTIARDRQGAPLIATPMSCEIGVQGQLHLHLADTVSVLATDEKGALALLQIACPLRPHSLQQVRSSALLAGYEELMEGNRERLGLPRLHLAGFWDFLRSAHARIEAPLFVPARSHYGRRLYREKLWWMADQVRHRLFPQVSRGSKQKPCRDCVFNGHCHDGDASGLRLPSQGTASVELLFPRRGEASQLPAPPRRQTGTST
jgi:hypothetical protein